MHCSRLLIFCNTSNNNCSSQCKSLLVVAFRCVCFFTFYMTHFVSTMTRNGVDAADLDFVVLQLSQCGDKWFILLRFTTKWMNKEKSSTLLYSQQAPVYTVRSPPPPPSLSHYYDQRLWENKVLTSTTLINMRLITAFTLISAMATAISAETRPKANEYKGNQW